MKVLSRDIYRILDANLNRSREGLRVSEEVARFALNSKALTEELKSARHKVSKLAIDLSKCCKGLVESRDVEGDVGKRSRLKSEKKRAGRADIFYANIQRVKESLRVLEEFAKLIDRSIAGRFQALRFKVYEIEKKATKRLEGLRHIG